MVVCCALAVFVIGQLYAIGSWCRVLLGLRPVGDTPINSAVSWRLGGPSAPTPTVAPEVSFKPPRPAFSSSLLRAPAVALLASIGALGVAVSVSAAERTDARKLEDLLTNPANFCRGRIAAFRAASTAGADRQPQNR